jgi:glycine cleavage system transcriptional repressor
MPHAILTAIGNDRPGLVDEVSQYIFQRGGNIEDSRMVNLRGQFAMMVLLSGSEGVLSRVRQELGDLSGQTSLQADLRPAQAPAAPAGEALPFRLRGTGLDQQGLVHRVSHLLRGMNVNIESLDSRLTPAPYTGAPMFEMELILAVPKATPLSQLRQKLAGVCDDLNIDWELEPV